MRENTTTDDNDSHTENPHKNLRYVYFEKIKIFAKMIRIGLYFV